MTRFTQLLVLFVLGTNPFLAQSASWEAIQKSGRLRASTEGAYPPFNFFKDEKLTGFEIDFVEAIAKKLGFSVEWKTGSFDTLLIGLAPAQDRYDIVAASHTVTPERAEIVEFTKPSYCSRVVIVSKTGGPLKLSDLKGKKVSIQVGTGGIPVVSKIIGASNLKTFPTDPEAMQALHMGRVDAWVSEALIVSAAMKENSSLRFVIGETLMDIKIAFALAKGNVSLRDKVNAAMAALVKDGTYKKLQNKYVDQDIACR